MTSRKNLIGYEYYDYLISSPKQYSQVVMAEAYDNNEIAMSSNSKEFTAIVLSGENVTSENTESSVGFANNNVRKVQFEDGIPRYAVRFRIIDDIIHNTTDFNLTHALPNPFSSDLNEAQRQRIISQHPIAYTMYPTFETNALTFGTLVSIREEGGEYFIIKNLVIQRTI